MRRQELLLDRVGEIRCHSSLRGLGMSPLLLSRVAGVGIRGAETGTDLGHASGISTEGREPWAPLP